MAISVYAAKLKKICGVFHAMNTLYFHTISYCPRIPYIGEVLYLQLPKYRSSDYKVIVCTARATLVLQISKLLSLNAISNGHEGIPTITHTNTYTHTHTVSETRADPKAQPILVNQLATENELVLLCL